MMRGARRVGRCEQPRRRRHAVARAETALERVHVGRERTLQQALRKHSSSMCQELSMASFAVFNGHNLSDVETARANRSR